MGKRGPKPKGRVKIEWSPNFAYAIGLIVTDGNLSKIGGRITLVSKDIEQIVHFKNILGLENNIGVHNSGSTNKKSFRVQFRDINFTKFLISIGVFPAKSKIIKDVNIPKKYFFDYLRGCFDGDGTIYSSWDKRWKSSYMFYLDFVSASKDHLYWLRNTINSYAKTKGYIDRNKYNDRVYRLRFAKNESLKLIYKMYKNKNAICLSRKKLKILSILAIVGMKEI